MRSEDKKFLVNDGTSRVSLSRSNANDERKKSALLLFSCVFAVTTSVLLVIAFGKYFSNQHYVEYIYVPKNKLVEVLYQSTSETDTTNIVFNHTHIGKTMCSGIPDDQKFDCYPDAPVQEEECLNRGCCWQVVPQNFKLDGFPPLNVPYCYFPADYVGYKIVNITSTKTGQIVVLQRFTPSGFPNDVAMLNMSLVVLDENRLRIKITDLSSKRFEVPLSQMDTGKEVINKSLSYSFHLTTDGKLNVVRRSTGTVVFHTDMRRLVYANQFLQLSSVLPSTVVYGIGEQYDSLLRSVNWTRNTLFNRDRAPLANMNLYGSHPFYVCLEHDGSSHGVLLLNSNSMDVILQPTPAVTFRTIGGILDFYVLLGPSPDRVIQQYSQIVGTTFMPPYWSLGFQLCRYGYSTLNETRKVWKRTRDANITFDVQWNDIDYMERNNDFTYDKVNFRDLPEFVDELHKNGMHYVIMIDPGVSGSEPSGTYPPYDDGIKSDVFIKNSTGQVFVGKVWNLVSTVFPDFSHPNAQSYWTKLFKDFHAQVPFDGAWIDMNEISNFYNGQINGCPENSSLENPPYIPGGLEPLRTKTLCMTAKHYTGSHYDEHNLHSFREAAATASALHETTGKRPFLISRATTTGHGVFGGHWSGDIDSSWEDMRYSVTSLLNFNIFGIPMMGSDICGFRGNTTEELCARWSALGAFYPFSRNHNDKSNIDQDPVSLGPTVTAAARNALRKRYALLPYLYTLFYQSHAFGVTVVKPLVFEYPQDEKTYALDETFLWGPALMVVPTLYPGFSSVAAYFPKDLWYNFTSGQQIQSEGQEITVDTPITDIRLFVRGGYILPMQYGGSTTTESRLMPFSLFAALNFNQEAYGELFWDDGDSIDTYENKQYNLIKFSLMNDTLSTEAVFVGYNSSMPLSNVKICSLKFSPTSVTVNGQKISYIFDEYKCLSVLKIQASLLSTNKISWK